MSFEMHLCNPNQLLRKRRYDDDNIITAQTSDKDWPKKRERMRWRVVEREGEREGADWWTPERPKTNPKDLLPSFIFWLKNINIGEGQL